MPPPSRPASTSDPLAFLAGGGEMGARTRTFDWSATPVGPAADWPQSLKVAVRILLSSRYAMWMGWGPDFTFFYNDAYARMTLGPKHPWALGRSAREVWSEIWADIGPRAERVIAAGEATWDERLLLFLERRGFKEESYHTFSYSPIPDDRGGVGGLLCVVTEETERAIGERRLKTLRELAARTTDAARSAADACRTAARALADNPHDLPFVLVYLTDGDTARLAGAAGLPAGSPAAPAAVGLGEDGPGWPLGRVLASGRAEVVTGLGDRFGPLPGGVWPEPPERAVVLPMAQAGQARPAGFVVAGLSPRLVFTDEYHGFLDLLAGQVATAVGNARAYEEERRRAEALAELDRAKTAFFSNVSHEFRTPLTLMLGPVGDLLAGGRADLPPAATGQLEVVNRNGLRLLRLVNSLLDFSRIEAGRARAAFRPTDLAARTADLASQFRSACDRAGLRLVVDCPPLAEPVYVDRDMWEKVVLNLVSNAFKFTFEGEIAVAVRPRGPAAELVVRDTGTGVPAAEMPRLFERFHRVENARGRTHEGSGIGLALVRELVQLHGGAIAAESEVGRGTTFVVTIPFGTAHLPPDQVGGDSAGPTGAGALPYVEEALRWLPDEGGVDDVPSPDRAAPDAAPPTPHAGRPRVLLADDNADMRQYVARLLAPGHRVEAVPDGAAALEAARRRPPDLILTDVMMPRLDGFGLLREVRADPRLEGVPVILLSARAGEESRVEGMEAGADDYLVKPFGARELLARVSAHLTMARLRREAGEAVRASEERFRGIFAQTLAGIAETDLTGRFVQVNPRYCEIVGRPAAELYGLRMQDITHPDDLPLNLPRFERAAADGTPFVIEKRYVRPDGSAVWVNNSVSLVRDGQGRPTNIVAACLDVTANKQAEAALRDSEAHFRSMADNAPAILWVTDPAGQCTYLNRRWYEFTGRPAGTDLGLGWLSAVHPDDGPRAKEALLVANARHAPFRIEYRLRRHDGQYRWAVAAALPRFEGGAFRGYVGTVFDVHDRRLGEEALREADRRKDEFLATLAHELRNPLAPLRNGLQVLKLAPGDARAAEQARGMMERQVGQLTHLIDDLMDVSRINRGKIVLQTARLRLADAILNAVDTSGPVIEQMGHALELDVPAEPVYVDADLTRLTQIFANLLNNAAKYTERGGRVRLAVERQGGDVLVRVTDTGVGIPAPMLPQVFDLFSQVDRSLEKSQGGLGIGLNIVRRLVELHGGTIRAESGGPGLGSTFTVRLPVAGAPAPGSGPAGDGEAAARPARRRILVVDDNRDGATSLAEVLSLMGNETRTAHDGLAAVAAAEAFRPDVILMDLGMPRLNGYDACRRIREQPWGRRILVAACTGWGQDEDRARSQEAGFDLHLVKPVDPAGLDRLLAAAG
ncbi:MAG TPA: ATP-binding protein [Gemmataceae bacterium]|nr:ATP-binding protein [Gemmataceae bacterium]